MANSAEDISQRIRQLNAATDRATGKAYSRDGSVFLEVTTLGDIASIWLADHAHEHGMAQLSEKIIECFREAHQAAMVEGAKVYAGFRE